MKISVKLLDHKEIAEGTVSFTFERPADFDFKAGQAIDMTLIDPPETDSEGNIRTFSIASSPEDAKLLIATRMRDTAFKRVLKGMSPGAEVQIEGPMGSFLLHNNAARPAVMLAGGIGVAPFRSMIRHAIAAKLSHKVYLFYSNRRPEDAAFLAEFQGLEKENANFEFVPTMTQMDASKLPWEGECGYVTVDMLRKHVEDLVGPIYYVAGPPAMVASMRKTLNDGGVDDDDIRTDEFSGY